MFETLAVIWNPSGAFLLGPISVRWYSVCWCIGLALAYVVVLRLYKKQQIPQEKFDPLFLYCFIGILVGARLGHCLLYEPSYFLSHPIEMLLPIRQDVLGSWHFTGYAGLASHGGSAGMFIALVLYSRRMHLNLLRVLDILAIATPLTAGFIRLGNLMNSEIVGKATGTDWGFIFTQLTDPTTGLPESFPRHPAQFYEAIAYFVIFLAGLWLVRRYWHKLGSGWFFGWLLTMVFSFRFFVEILKEVQEPWELQMQDMIGINQGQFLSIPFIIAGVLAWVGCFKRWGDAPATDKSA